MYSQSYRCTHSRRRKVKQPCWMPFPGAGPTQTLTSTQFQYCIPVEYKNLRKMWVLWHNSSRKIMRGCTSWSLKSLFLITRPGFVGPQQAELPDAALQFLPETCYRLCGFLGLCCTSIQNLPPKASRVFHLLAYYNNLHVYSKPC